MFLKNHPDYSALPGARQNTHYAELGIRDIFTSKSPVGAYSKESYKFVFGGVYWMAGWYCGYYARPMNADCDFAESDKSAGQSGVMPSAPQNAPFFQQADWLSFGATTLLALVVYLFTLAPDVGLDNSGVWSTAGAYGGVSSPPGYPLWTLWAWVFTKLLPFSNIAWRVAVSSAMAGALACGLIALMVSRGGTAILDQMADHQRLMPKKEKWLRAICGYVAGMVFGLNGAFWPQAVIVAVWPLSILLLCLVLCLLQRWSFQPELKRYLYAAALVYGLLLTNSQIEFAFAPAIPFLVMTGNPKTGRDMFLVAGFLFLAGLGGICLGHFPSLRGGGGQFFYILLGVITCLMGIGLVIKTRQAFSEWKAILICSGLFLLGLAVYFYPPIASMTNPPVNWGYPRTVEGFFHMVTRGQYERMNPTVGVGLFLGQARLYFIVAGKEFGWPYLLLCLIPFYFLHRMAAAERRRMLGLLPAYICLAFLMLAVLNPGLDRQSQDLEKVYFSASYIVVALWMGYGLIILGAWLARPGKQPQTAHFPI